MKLRPAIGVRIGPRGLAAVAHFAAVVIVPLAGSLPGPAKAVGTGADAVAGPSAPVLPIESLALAIRLNHIETGLVLPIGRQGQRWLIARDELARLPIRPPQGWAGLPSEVALERQPGIEVSFDESEQRLDLVVPASWLTGGLARVGGAGLPTPPLPPSAGPTGLVFNYDLAYSHGRDLARHDSRSDQLAAATEWRWFDRGSGVLTHTQLHRTGRGGSEGDWQRRSVRLDTRWRLAQPQRMLQWQIGDAVTEGGPGQRPVRFGGLQVGTDFGLQPYRATTVLPAYFGSVGLPSTIDLFIDGMRRYQGRLQPGAFALDAMPGIAGSGEATIVVTDALGRTQTIAFPFYATSRLLYPGLTRWSLAAGFARLQYGIESTRYDDRPLVSGSWRHGLTRTLTVEGSVEAMADLRSVGLSAAWAPGRVGVLSPQIAFSDSRRTAGVHRGMQYGIGYEWNNRTIGVQVEWLRTDRDYRDIAGRYDAVWARSTQRLGFGWGLGQIGSVGMNWVRRAVADGEDEQFVTANWARNLGPRWGLNLSVTRGLGGSRQSLALLGLTRRLGPARTASLGLDSRPGRNAVTAGYAQAMTPDDRQSWRLQATGGDTPLLQAEATREWSSLRAQISGQAQGDRLFGWASAQGAVAWMSGYWLTARSIPDAFALVSTDGIADVPVRIENRPVGRTDPRGLLLVAPLHGWQSNRVAIDALDLPADLWIETAHQQVAVRGLAGTQARFPMRRVRSATVVLIDPAGEPLPAGTVLTVQATDAAGSAVDRDAVTRVGLDGEVWIDQLAATGNRIEVRDAGPGRAGCSVHFDYPAEQASPARIGPLVCRAAGSGAGGRAGGGSGA